MQELLGGDAHELYVPPIALPRNGRPRAQPTIDTVGKNGIRMGFGWRDAHCGICGNAFVNSIRTFAP
jgi:hypothetical protein